MIWGLLAFTTSFLLMARVWPGDISGVELPSATYQPVLHPDGRVICFLTYPGRIQTYDQQGRFLKGWNVHSGKDAAIALTGEGVIELESYAGWSYYTAEGKLIENAPYQHSTRESDIRERASKQMADLGTGVSVDVRGALLWSRVVLVARDGKETAVVSTPWYLWPWSFPVVGIFMLLAGAILHGFVTWVSGCRYMENEVPIGHHSA